VAPESAVTPRAVSVPVDRARWAWPGLLSALVVVALLLAWADSTALRELFPTVILPARRPPHPGPLPPPMGFFGGLGSVGGLFSFWWFLAAGAGVSLITLAVLAALPTRVRVAADYARTNGLSRLFAAGVAAAILLVAVTVLLRVTFFLLSVVPFVWAAALLGAVFGTASLALALGRALQGMLGRAHPLQAAGAAVLLFFDIAMVPVVGWIGLALLALTALGVAVVTRLGSAQGWSLEDLDCR
jgi:hypothetical protein